MSIAAGIEVETDLATLVGELEEQACESLHHEDAKAVHDDGPATHYVQSFHQCYGRIGNISTRCAKAAKAIQSHALSLTQCGNCGEVDVLLNFITVIGPISATR